MKKLTALLCVLLFVMLMFSACGKEQKSLGQITEIQASSIVVALGTEKEMPRDDKGKNVSGEQAKPPQEPEGESSKSKGETAVPNQESNNDGEEGVKDQSPPPSDGGLPSILTLTGESVELKITEQTVITKEDREDTLDISSLSVGDVVRVTYEGNKAKAVILQTMDDPMTDDSTGSIELVGVFTVDGTEETKDEDTVGSDKENTCAVLVKNGGKLTMGSTTVTKSGDTTSVDESNFYGLNGAVVATASSSAVLSDVAVNTEAEGANAVFATGEGASVTIDGITIHTSGNSSRGLDATYGGSISAEDVDITTTGAHCAALATDRGEGTVKVVGGTLSTSGDGSPCIYSTGDISAENVTGMATGSQSMVVEGKNSITVRNCDFTGAGLNGVMIYQSTSGDAGVGAGILNATDSTIATTSDGPMFYITNTEAAINLTNVNLAFPSDILVNVSGNETNNWGTPGSNGGNLTFTAKNQTLTGDIVCDEISVVSLGLFQASSLTGAIDTANSGTVSLSLSSDATWEVTADSHISSLTDDDASFNNIVSNGYTIYYDSDNEANQGLDGKTITLSDGGKLTPAV